MYRRCRSHWSLCSSNMAPTSPDKARSLAHYVRSPFDLGVQRLRPSPWRPWPPQSPNSPPRWPVTRHKSRAADCGGVWRSVPAAGSFKRVRGRGSDRLLCGDQIKTANVCSGSAATRGDEQELSLAGTNPSPTGSAATPPTTATAAPHTAAIRDRACCTVERQLVGNQREFARRRRLAPHAAPPTVALVPLRGASVQPRSARGHWSWMSKDAT
jgi:hypothetical protein